MLPAALIVVGFATALGSLAVVPPAEPVAQPAEPVPQPAEPVPQPDVAEPDVGQPDAEADPPTAEPPGDPAAPVPEPRGDLPGPPILPEPNGPNAPEPQPDGPADSNPVPGPDVAPPIEPLPAPPSATAPESLGLDLDWSAPAGCPARDGIVSRLSALLDRPVDELVGAAVSVRGHLVTTPAGYALDLEVRSASVHDNRRLHASDCVSITDAAALVAATAVDPTRVAETLDSHAAAPRRPVAAAHRNSSPRRVGGAIRVAAGLGYGFVPGAAGGLQADAALIIARARVEFGAGHWFAKRSDNAPATARVRLTAAGIRGCYAPYAGPVELPLCVGMQFGAMHARLEGPNRSFASRQFWTAIEAGPGIAWAPHPNLALVGRVDAQIALVRPRFVYDDDTTAERVMFATPSAAVRVLVGAEARF